MRTNFYWQLTHSVAVTLLLILFCGYNLWAQIGEDNGGGQNTPTLEELVKIPPSPEAQAFIKYGSTPVSLYTGSPNISIPIHTIQGKDIQMPISLTYDASGVKVNQLATWVGLGWNLNAGGAVTRQQNGKVDDWITASPQYQMYYSDAFVGSGHTINEDYEFVKHFVDNGAWKPAGEYGRFYDFIDKVKEGYFETQPDVYSFSINGLSGTLFIDYSNLSAHCMEHPGLRVEVLTNGNTKNLVITGWIIDDTQGNRYTFSQVERTLVRQNNTTDDVQVYNSSWLITSIVSERDVIEFDYTAPQSWEKPQYVGSTEVYIDQNANENLDRRSGGSLPTYEITQSELRAILLNGNEEMTLLPSAEDRADLRGRNALEAIQISDVFGNELRSYYFNQSYFGDDMTDEYAVRLKLDGIELYGQGNGEAPQVYDFHYISGDLPRRGSFGQDYWGYYTGRDTSPTLIPYNAYFDQYNTTFQGANRTPNFQFAKRGTLKKITYPTGGTSEYHYQPHRSKTSVWQEGATEVLYNGVARGGQNDTDPYDFFQCDDAHGAYNTKPNGTDNLFLVKERTQYYMDIRADGIVVPNQLGNYQFFALYRSGDIISCDTPPGNTFDFCHYTDEVKQPCDFIDPVNGPSAFAEYQFFDQLPQGYNERFPITLDPGVYRVVMLNSDENITLQAKVTTPDVIDHHEVGGLRVFKIVDKSDATEMAQTRFFHYDALSRLPVFDETLFAGENGKGTLHLPLNFESSTKSTGFVSNGSFSGPGTTETVERGGNNKSNGDHYMTYPVVTEIAFDGTFDQGYVENYFHDKRTTHTAIYRKSINNNGKLYEQRTYDATKGLVQKQTNHYSNSTLGSEIGFGISPASLANPNSILDRYIHTELGSTDESVIYKFQAKTASGTDFCNWDGRNYWVWEASNQSQFDDQMVEALQLKNQFIAQGKLDVRLESWQADPVFIPRRGWIHVSYQQYNVVSCAAGVGELKISKFTLPMWWNRLDSTTTVQYFEEGSLRNVTRNTYDATYRHFQLVQSETINSDGSQSLQKLFYPHDITELSALAGLIENNNISELIRTETWRDGALQQTSQLDYNYYGGKILASGVRQSFKDHPLEDVFEITAYDNHGNPTEVIGRNQVPKTYLWAYDHTLPVFQIQNASLDEVNSVLLVHGVSDVNAQSETQLLQLGQFLRNDLPKARVTTVLYDPGVGMKLMKDANGRATAYEYDDFNRLRLVRDGQGTTDYNGNILQMHTYNYDEGYQRTFTYRTPRTTELSESASMALDKSQVSVTTQYVDGLGRLEQTVSKQASPNGKDLVSFVEFDGFGRNPVQYLPYAEGTTGTKKSHPVIEQINFFYGQGFGDDGDFAFSEQVFDQSPLNRVLTQHAPGLSWNREESPDRGVTSVYRTNMVSDQVIRWGLNDEGFYHDGLYPASNGSSEGSLIVSETTNENGFKTIEFKEKSGQVILKKVQKNTSEYLSTYYLYDDLNNLRYVIQPEGVRQFLNQGNTAVSPDWVGQFCFQYQYDYRNRMIVKKVPGAEASYMVYDLNDRLILSQQGNDHGLSDSGDANLELIYEDLAIDQYQGQSYALLNNKSGRLTSGFSFTSSAGESFRLTSNEVNYTSEWDFTKYDVYDRPVQTGRVSLVGNRDAIQSQVNGESVLNEASLSSGGLLLYTNQAFPRNINSSNVLTVSYYDDYDFTTETPPAGAEMGIKGLATGAKTKVLGSSDFMSTVSFYDEQLRVIKAVGDNHAGGNEVVTNSYINKVLPSIAQSVRTQTAHGFTTTVEENFAYDHADRLLSVTHRVDGQAPVTLLRNSYNERGELQEKELSNEELSTSYQYNIRGWLTHINGGTTFDSQEDVFGMELLYNAAGQYNGNIGQIKWKTVGGNGVFNGEQTYTYTYDGANRLKIARYTGQSNDMYNVGGNDAGIRYDNNGNILNLFRRGTGGISDDLLYAFTGNRLMRVDDQASEDPNALFLDGNTSGDDYAYDANGNMIQDLNKGITEIRYNHLNLPELVIKSNGDQIAYTYDAAGTKLRKVSTIGNNTEATDYLSGFHYVNNDLKFLQHAEGRAIRNGAYFAYEYNMTDHLGNVRASVNRDGVLKQRDDYYPFGLSFNSSATSPENLYKYNGKEEQRGWGVFDYQARFYDPALGKFLAIDPHSENYLAWSPYNYVGGNPILRIDPDGKDWEDVVKGFKALGNHLSETFSSSGAKNVADGFSEAGQIMNSGLGDGYGAVFGEDSKAGVSAEGKINFGLQIAGEVEKGAGLTANLGALTIIKGKIGISLSSEGVSFNFDIDPIGGEGGIEGESEFSASLLAGGGVKNTITLDENGFQDKFSGSVGVAGVSAELENNLTTGQVDSKLKAGANFNIALFLGISGGVNAEIEKNVRAKREE
ncbi:MAG: DUF6443 domain-containing protein [Cytophagales bacterium]|nr:DUF6443 domain-containing protein [Cytophagales bacterium]